MKKYFNELIKKYLVACVKNNTDDRNYYLGYLQGIASSAFWNDNLEDYSYYNSEIEKAIYLIDDLRKEINSRF